MFCPICGSRLPDDARFCPECGCNVADYLNDPDAEPEITSPDYDPAYEAEDLGYGPGKENARSEGYAEDLPENGAYGDDAYEEEAPRKTAAPGNSGPKAGLTAAAAVLALAVIGGGVFLASRLFSGPEKDSGNAAASVSSAEAADSSSEKDGGLLGGLFSGKTSSPEDKASSETDAADAEGQSTGTEGSGDTPQALTASPVKALERPTLYSSVTLNSDPVIASVPVYTADENFDNIVNYDAFYFNDWQEETLAENGFCVWMEGWDEFYEVYESNRYTTVANFVTVDSMMHTYHLYFSHLMKNVERDSLFSLVSDLTAKMQEKSIRQMYALKGTEWESASIRNVAFFSVAAALLDDSAAVPSEVSENVATELQRIYSASAIDSSTLADNYMEDYSQYTVRGYYEGDPLLERYFRCMMWYGRMNFTQKDEDLDRSALLLTMALDDDTLPAWESVYTVTSFFAGASDDCGYYEYRPILDEAYGEEAEVTSLPGNTEAWDYYHAMTAEMEAPKINSMVFIDDETSQGHEEEAKGFRFMGQRFSIDAAILQNLVYSHVGEDPSGGKRMLPDALDVPAALGSDTALSILEQRGNSSYSGYSENMQLLRTQSEEIGEDTWYASLYSQWLYTLMPLLDQKGEGYPGFMQTDAWTRKNLQSYLGSYTELKHDTVLYSKQVMAEMGGGPMETFDDRGYVEAEPVVFRRLEALTQATRTGLAGYGLLSSADDSNLGLLQDLASQLAAVAEKELKNEVPTDAEFELIRGYGGQLEHFWQEVYKDEASESGIDLSTRNFPAAIVTDIATDPNGTVKELGTGRTSTIYVIVPVDGSLRIASGSVYSFYQFEHPLSDRLTDTAWRRMMGFEMNENGSYSQPSVSVEDWTKDFQHSWRDDYP